MAPSFYCGVIMLARAEKPITLSPVERLGALLAADLTAVNDLILTRMGSDVPLIPQIAGYLIAAGGKRLRPLLTIAAARLAGDVSARSHLLAAAVEFIHSASLLHDDVVDEGDKRRGQPSANAKFGNQSSVLVGDFLFARAFELMVEDGSLDVLQILSKASTTITEGEILQLQIAGDVDATEDQYLKVIHAKTAALFAAATEIGPILAGQPHLRRVFHDYGYNLGIAFQLSDDVLDYTRADLDLHKTLGNDFQEGKLTLPVLLAIQAANADEKTFWARVIGTPQTQIPADLQQAQQLMQKHAVFTRAVARAADYAAAAKTALAAAPPSPIKNLLLEIADYCAARAR